MLESKCPKLAPLSRNVHRLGNLSGKPLRLIGPNRELTTRLCPSLSPYPSVNFSSALAQMGLQLPDIPANTMAAIE